MRSVLCSQLRWKTEKAHFGDTSQRDASSIQDQTLHTGVTATQAYLNSPRASPTTPDFSFVGQSRGVSRGEDAAFIERASARTRRRRCRCRRRRRRRRRHNVDVEVLNALPSGMNYSFRSLSNVAECVAGSWIERKREKCQLLFGLCTCVLASNRSIINWNSRRWNISRLDSKSGVISIRPCVSPP